MGENVMPDDVSALRFDATGSPARIIFGRGARHRVPEILGEMGLSRVLVLSTLSQRPAAEAFAATLGPRCVGVHAGALMHTPVPATDEAVKVVQAHRADAVLALGGGSTIGLAKAIAWRTDLLQIAVPTTYAGSEVTNILGQTENGVKTTLKSPKVIPETVIYDPELTLGLPALISVTSGTNAIAHAIEALYARDRNPITQMMASKGANLMIAALPEIVAEPQNIAARERALCGSWLCGTVLGQVGMALHHKLCHTLGGLFDLPHAETHTVILPHVMAYNGAVVADCYAPLHNALGPDEPWTALWSLLGRLGTTRSLRDLGMPESGITTAAELATTNQYWNPRPVDQDAIKALITAAYWGESPRLL